MNSDGFEEKFFLGLSEEGFHRVAYTEWGENAKNPVPIICVHGLTRNSRDFDPLAAFLSTQGRHVFCPDVVGRGESDWLKNPLFYTYEQYIADMTTMIARTNAEEIDWIGTSMGGLLGMFIASVQNTPIKRLVLNDIGPQIPTQALARMSKYVGLEPSDFKSLDAAKQYYKSVFKDFGNLNEADWDRITVNSVREVSPGNFVPKLDNAIKTVPAKSKIAWQALLHPLKALEGSLFDIDLWHIWRNIHCPVLVIHGEKSDLLLPSIIKKMQQSHERVEVLKVPDTGHAPLLFEREYQQAIYNWLNKPVGLHDATLSCSTK